jgi:hypothetical protein
MLTPIASPRTEPEAELEHACTQVLLDMRCVRTGQGRKLVVGKWRRSRVTATLRRNETHAMSECAENSLLACMYVPISSEKDASAVDEEGGQASAPHAPRINKIVVYRPSPIGLPLSR